MQLYEIALSRRFVEEPGVASVKLIWGVRPKTVSFINDKPKYNHFDGVYFSTANLEFRNSNSPLKLRSCA